ncbi:hypothetical protein ABPG77_001863 [Micractinium sp. CCAP 211/92]
MTKRALICGCNYPGSNAQLNGCINDCLAMRQLLTQHFGFAEGDITMMLDTDASTTSPTGANIKAKLREMVSASKSGDVLFFHFSGHGTQVPDDGESDGFDEAICPTDMNVIADDDLRDIFSKLAPGVKFTMIADCCHSGTLLDHQAIAISGPKPGEAVPSLGGLLGGLLAGRGVDGSGFKNRALPTNTFLDMLSAKLGTSVGKGNVRSSLVSLFGNASSRKAINYSQLASQASAAYQGFQKGNYSACMPFLKSLVAACGGGGAATSGGPAPGEPNLAISHTPGASGTKEQPLPDHVGILITGCQSNETSADACPSGNPKEAFGALSNSINTVLAAHFKQNPGAPISYRTLVTGVREALGKSGYSQNPCLECSPANADTNFILP